jgi:hypothetical protein
VKKLIIFIFYSFSALFLVTFIGDCLNLYSEGGSLIDNNIVKSTIDTINKPLNTLNFKVNNIISDNFSSTSPTIKYNLHINNYKYNLNTKRILYLNSVFENIIQEMYRFNHYSYSSSPIKFDSITNMCRFTEKYLYDNFLINGNPGNSVALINKLTMQEYFELINNIKNIKFNNPKLYYILCDNIKDNILLDSNSAALHQYITNKSYILDHNWLREPIKLNLSNSWETLLNKNKSILNDDLPSPSTIIDLYSTNSINSTPNLINTNNPSNYNSPIFRDKIRFTGTELYKEVSTNIWAAQEQYKSPTLNEVFSFNSRNSLVEGLGIFDNTTESPQDKNISQSILKSSNTNQTGAELPITQNKSVRFNLKDNN